jgi:membrane-bound lytic murein transglycosylase A
LSREGDRRSGIAAVLGGLALAALVALAWWLWPAPAPRRPAGPGATGPAETAPPPPPRLDLQPATFADLPGWAADDPSPALAAFRRSCAAWRRQPDDRPLDADAPWAGTLGDWRGVCAAAAEVPAGPAAARAFFADLFVPVAATNRGAAAGLFTGYYEPTLRGSRRRHGAYTVPLYTRPPELVEADLGEFRDELRGERIAGRVVADRLVPFADRAAIDTGALGGRGLELVWVDDPVEAFFLHVQGSGRVELDDGSTLRVGYAAQNGHPYVAIGRVLVDRGDMELDEVSMQSLRAWLAAHPEEAAEVMAANPSYVFFRRLAEEGPLGAQGVVLTPGRSLAVDRSFHPLGVPVWLAATAPSPRAGEPDLPLRRLLVAQDTGGAIRGPVRGDVFWGPGDDAAEIAGRMKHEGRMWLLLPKELAAGVTTASAARPGA